MGWGTMKPLDQGSLNHTPAVAPALAGLDAHRIDADSVPKRDKRETAFAFEGVVNDICALPWEAISEAEVGTSTTSSAKNKTCRSKSPTS